MPEEEKKQNKKIEARDKLLEKKKKTEESIDGELAKLNIEIESERILNHNCINCGLKLPISSEDLEEFLTEGLTHKKYVCEQCNLINTLSIRFEGDPDYTTAEIFHKDKGLKYKGQPAKLLTDDECLNRIFYEANLVEAGRSRLNPIDQILMKGVAVGLQRLGVEAKQYESMENSKK